MKKSLFILAFSALFVTSCKDNAVATTKTATETSTETKKLAVGKVETASFTIEGMSCEIMCASKIQKKLATIEYDAAVTSPEKLVEKVEAVNGGDSYKVSNVKSSADHAMLFQEKPKEKEKKKSRKERKADEKAAAEGKTEAKSEKPACCSSKKACSEKKETM